jgi:hypothetical protein
MVSAQINGTYRLYIENPQGRREPAGSGLAYWWGPGGSSEGVIANTPEKWNFLPLSKHTGGPGYKILLTLTAGANATADASDGVMVLPVLINGTQAQLGNSAHATGIGTDEFTVTRAAADIAYVAQVETPVLIYTAKEGVNFKIGGGTTFISIENNA